MSQISTVRFITNTLSPTRLVQLGLALSVLALMPITPAHAKNRSCTNAEMRRISDSFIIDCFKIHGAYVRCQSNGDPVCCRNTPWGTKCTSTPGSSTLDPGSGPVRPPRAGRPDPGPDRVNPPSRPPRAGGDTGPSRVGPANDPRPPRMDPGPSRVGPSSNPTDGGGSIPRSSGGNGKR